MGADESTKHEQELPSMRMDKSVAGTSLQAGSVTSEARSVIRPSSVGWIVRAESMVDDPMGEELLNYQALERDGVDGMGSYPSGKMATSSSVPQQAASQQQRLEPIRDPGLTKRELPSRRPSHVGHFLLHCTSIPKKRLPFAGALGRGQAVATNWQNSLGICASNLLCCSNSGCSSCCNCRQSETSTDDMQAAACIPCSCESGDHDSVSAIPGTSSPSAPTSEALELVTGTELHAAPVEVSYEELSLFCIP